MGYRWINAFEPAAEAIGAGHSVRAVAFVTVAPEVAEGSCGR